MSKQSRYDLGMLGEQLVASLFRLEISDNAFDTKKDMTCKLTGQTIEVKTQNRYPQKHCFSIETSKLTNLIKCLTVDLLIFVEYDNSDIIRIWKTLSRKNTFFYTLKSGKEMLGFPIDDMELIKEIDDPVLASKFKSLTQSKYVK